MYFVSKCEGTMHSGLTKNIRERYGGPYNRFYEGRQTLSDEGIVYDDFPMF